MRIKLAILFIFLLFMTSGCGCNPNIVSSEAKKLSQPVTINYWGVFNDEDSMRALIESYQQVHPNITVKYRKWRYDEYEEELVDAFAEDKGPDIFSIHNTWIDGYKTKIMPAPDTYKMVFQEVQGSIKKEVIPVVKNMRSLSLKQLQSDFIEAVYNDVVLNNDRGQEKIYGLPLSVDTLALFYNKDLLNNANIASPPQYWNRDFQKMIKKLTKQDTNGLIVQSGIALGGSNNIERYGDILSVLMMQNGAEMVDSSGYIRFHTVPQYFTGQNRNPGLEALQFYTDFANPLKEVYCWNKDLDNSLQLFERGNLAFMLGYSYHIPEIRASAPKLNFAIAKLPQIENSALQINFANYWVETVSSKSKNKDVAWDFVQFATAKPENAKLFLEKTKRPTALRALIDEQKEDKEIGVFAEQLLTSKSWYKGKDALAADKIIAEMIDSAVAGKGKLEDVLRLGATKVQQTVK